MLSDTAASAEYAAVAEHLRRLHEPGFGRPHSITEPHVTADGAQVIVTGTVFDELVGTPRTAIYRVAEGEFTEVPTGTGSARCARLSPDGRTLAFLSDRAMTGVFQLFLLSDERGEVAAPSVPGSVEYAHWSPDGRCILLGVAGLAADLAGGQGSGRIAVDDSPSDWHPTIEDGTCQSGWRSVWLYTVDGQELRELSTEGMNCWEAGWCGPSHVVAVTSRAPAEDDWYDAVWTLIDISTGVSRELLHSEVQLGLPAGSPDGRYACIVQAVCSDRGIVAGDLTLVDLASGSQTGVDTGGTDVTAVQWIDTDRLGYLGQRHLDSVAGVIDVRTGTYQEIASTAMSFGGGRYPDGAFLADGRAVVVRSGYDLPPQLARLGGDGCEVLASTAHAGTDYLSSVAGTAEPVTWAAPDGLQVEGILCRPPGTGPFPVVMHVHGGPIWAYRNTWSMSYAWVPLLVSRGYAVLNPNPRGSGGRGQKFAQQVVGDMGGADTYDHLSGIDALVERGVADPSRIGLIGGSYGGFMSSWLVTQDSRFAAAVALAPVTDWYSKFFTSNNGVWAKGFLGADPEQPGSLAHTRSPVLQASKARTPCLNVAGAKDRCTPPGQAREFHQALLAHGVESVLAIYPQEGHGVRAYPAMTDFLTRVVLWFERHMPARPLEEHCSCR